MNQNEKHILVISSEVPIHELLLQHLEKHGLTVTTSPLEIASIGAESLSKAGLILLSIDRSDDKALVVLRRIRQIRPRTPIWCLVGHSTEHGVKHIHTAGSDRCIPKPFGLQKLVEEVLVQLSERQSHTHGPE